MFSPILLLLALVALSSICPPGFTAAAPASTASRSGLGPQHDKSKLASTKNTRPSLLFSPDMPLEMLYEITSTFSPETFWTLWKTSRYHQQILRRLDVYYKPRVLADIKTHPVLSGLQWELSRLGEEATNGRMQQEVCWTCLYAALNTPIVKPKQTIHLPGKLQDKSYTELHLTVLFNRTSNSSFNEAQPSPTSMANLLRDHFQAHGSDAKHFSQVTPFFSLKSSSNKTLISFALTESGRILAYREPHVYQVAAWSNYVKPNEPTKMIVRVEPKTGKVSLIKLSLSGGQFLQRRVIFETSEAKNMTLIEFGTDLGTLEDVDIIKWRLGHLMVKGHDIVGRLDQEDVDVECLSIASSRTSSCQLTVAPDANPEKLFSLNLSDIHLNGTRFPEPMLFELEEWQRRFRLCSGKT